MKFFLWCTLALALMVNAGCKDIKSISRCRENWPKCQPIQNKFCTHELCLSCSGMRQAGKDYAFCKDNCAVSTCNCDCLRCGSFKRVGCRKMNGCCYWDGGVCHPHQLL